MVLTTSSNSTTKLLTIYLIVVFFLTMIPTDVRSDEITVFGPTDFIREIGKPVKITHNFTVQYPVEDTMLRVHIGGLPGSTDDKKVVSSSIISLNGERLFKPQDFNKKVYYLEAPVTLERENTLEVEVRSKPGAVLTIFITGISGIRAIPGAHPTSGYAPLTVRFTTNGEDPDGTIEVFQWDFDGNGTWDTYDTVARDYTHTYSTPGTYNATLYVQSNSGETATASISIVVLNNPPVANADIIPSNGAVPLEVNLYGSGTDPDGTITLYEWDFEGNGTFDWSSTTTGNTTHTYISEGVYQAVFRVTDNDNQTATATAVTTVVRAGPPGSPTATASATPTSGNAPLNVNFNGTATDSDGSIALYEWDFENDGTYDWSSTSTGATSHTYTNAGTHIATFRATDNDGLTGIDQLIIFVDLTTSLSVSNNTVGYNLEVGLINYCRLPGVVINASSVYDSYYYPATNAIDGQVETYWVSAYGDTPNQGASTFIEVTFPSPQTVTQVNLKGGSWWVYYGITRGRLEFFDASNALLHSQVVEIPSDSVQIPISEIQGVTKCRLTALAANYDYPVCSLGEFEVGQLPPTQEVTGTSINTSISAATSVSVYIRDADYNFIRTLVDNEFRELGSYSDSWDCRDDTGFIVNDGLYYAVLTYLLDGVWHELDLAYTTGGNRYEFPFGSGCNTRDSFPYEFYPFEDDFLPLTFRVCPAQEVTAFIGPLWSGTDQTRIRTIVNRKPFPNGQSTIYWDGLDDEGNVAQEPPGDNLITGFWRYSLPDNAMLMTGGKPEISDVSAYENYFSPFSEGYNENGNCAGVTISYTLSEDAQYVELRVYSVETSALLRTLTENNVNAGLHSVFWDGKNNNDEYVDFGDYRVGVLAKDMQGNESMLRYALVRIDF